MGDRNNPMKFGPEWLRNLSRERSIGSSGSNNQNSSGITNTNNAGSSGAPGLTPNPGNAGGGNAGATANALPKVQLAKLRYGREEMLALYDRSSPAPPELKFIDALYHPRGKPPVALNNTFEDELGESVRAGPPIGNISQVDRFGLGRVGRGSSVSDGRGRPRMPFVRQTSAGRGSWHLGSTRTPYSGGADDDTSTSLRSWNNSNGSNTAIRNSGDLAEWTQNKMFRNKRPGSSTNWRQPTREDEWRAPDGSKPRSSQQDKWERDWGDRPNQEKSQSWNNNRRTWVGGDSQNDDNLPEWAMDNAEACAGTFDSSGAFHGYSNDDSNLPKTQETAYPLTRSHTHGIFVRSKTAEEGSDEWWASEKAKKLSPKRFDASDIKFKKPSTSIADVNVATSSNTKDSASTEDNPPHNDVKTPETPAATSEPPENNNASIDDNFNKKNVRFTESKTFDALMRSDINIEEANDDRSNFQSVMIAPNNSLRQKHQNIVSTTANMSNRQNPNILKQDILQIFQNNQSAERDPSKQHQTPVDKIVEDLVDMTLEDKEIISSLPKPNETPLGTPSTGMMSSGLPNVANTMSQMSNSMMQLRIPSPVLPNQGLMTTKPGGMQSGGIPSAAMQGGGMQPGVMQASGMGTPGMQPGGLSSSVGISNAALNAAMRLPIGNTNNALNQTMGIPIPGVPQQVLQNQGMPNPTMGAAGRQNAGAGPIPSFQNQQNKTNVFPMHALQHSGSDAAFSSSIYANILPQSPTPSVNTQNLSEQWYYEDPTKQIQGPFSSKDMYNWYRAGFFSPNLMVRRACDSGMRPLGSYGPIVPFAQMDMMYPLSSSFESRSQVPRDTMLNSQQGLGLDVMNMNLSESNSMQFGTVGMLGNPPYAQQQMDSLWSQPDLLWMQQAVGPQRAGTGADTRLNNLPMFFWDQQPSAFTSNAMLPEEIAKEMKTEDQILAQLRASQNINTPQNLHFLNESPTLNVAPAKPEDTLHSATNVTPNLKELHKLIQEDKLKDAPISSEINQSILEPQIKDKNINDDQVPLQELNILKTNRASTTNAMEAKTAVLKAEVEKSVKNKENTTTKNKTKKGKEEKKDEFVEIKSKEEEISKTEKKIEEPSKKKEEKANKKDVEKEKKEWLKEGFTVVKAEKISKENKKKVEELLKNAEEAERKRKEEEKLAAEEEKKRKQAEIAKKQQELQQQQHRQAMESASRKAPWSGAANPPGQSPSREGLTLADIQRLERGKKLEQMREQHQMMQLIAQQQAAALARDQEISLGWAKKKGNSAPTTGQSLAEIQAETRKQAAAAAAAAAASAAAQAPDEANPAQPAPAPAPSLAPAPAPWAHAQNGGGFWDTLPNQSVITPASPKIVEPNKNKKKATSNMPAKKDSSPAADFEMWCNTVLAAWNSKIDVPTFVSFLKDIESPYEVKDYVKCYLGESKDTNDFSRQFLERRSKLLRVGMVTPSDDLCSPAMAVNPRTISGSDYQEVKGKSKKTKKNKMLKVDARILGFSVTAAEDRINVGDIDTV